MEQLKCLRETVREAKCNKDVSYNVLSNTIFIFLYFRESSRSLGFSLVVDARGSKQSRDILECIGRAVKLFEVILDDFFSLIL